MPKFAPRNSVGQLPYFIVVWTMGRKVAGIYYAQNAPQARRFALPQATASEYIFESRRATPEDLEVTSVVEV